MKKQIVTFTISAMLIATPVLAKEKKKPYHYTPPIYYDMEWEEYAPMVITSPNGPGGINPTPRPPGGKPPAPPDTGPVGRNPTPRPPGAADGSITNHNPIGTTDQGPVGPNPTPKPVGAK